MRQAAKVDTNQREIVETLRAYGCSVISTAAAGHGHPDLLVGVQGRTYLVEVKDGSRVPSKRKLTADQVDWHAAWRGEPVDVIETVEQALEWAKRRVFDATA